MTMRLTASLGILLISMQALAQEEGRARVFLGGGLVLPLAPELFKDGWGEGYDLAGGIGLEISPRLEIQGIVSFNRFPLDRDRANEEGGFRSGSSARSIDRGFLTQFGYDPDLVLTPFDILYGPRQRNVEFSGGATRMVSFSGELRFSFVGDPSRISPYVLIGGGLAHLSREDAKGTTSSPGLFPSERSVQATSETAPHINVGGGVDVPASSRIVIFAEGHYQITFTEGDTTAQTTIRVGIRIGL